MLVLTRKPGDVVQIDEDIELTILSIEGRRVRLGFNAPKIRRIVTVHVEKTPPRKPRENHEPS